MPLTGTLIWYYYICPREVWLMSRNLQPDQENPFIQIGRLISEGSYKREKKEIRLENIVIDIVKTEEDLIIGEVKKSSKFLKSATMQLAYYLLTLKRYGIDAKGELMFPKEKKKIPVLLTEEIENELMKAQKEIEDIISKDTPPLVRRIKFCKSCGYQELCFA